MKFYLPKLTTSVTGVRGEYKRPHELIFFCSFQSLSVIFEDNLLQYITSLLSIGNQHSKENSCCLLRFMNYLQVLWCHQVQWSCIGYSNEMENHKNCPRKQKHGITICRGKNTLIPWYFMKLFCKCSNKYCSKNSPTAVFQAYKTNNSGLLKRAPGATPLLV